MKYLRSTPFSVGFSPKSRDNWDATFGKPCPKEGCKGRVRDGVCDTCKTPRTKKRRQR